MAMFEQMLVMFLLMLAGFLGRKLGVIGRGAGKTLSALVVNIGNPALILLGSIGGEDRVQGIELLFTLALAFGLYALLILVSYGLVPLLRVKQESRGTYRVMTVFQNLGFMGFPLISAMFGKEALIYGTLFLIPYNVIIYTYGIRAISKEGEKEGLRLRRLLNVGVLASLLSLLIYSLRLPVPAFAVMTITHLSGLTAPLSMMVIGASLAEIPLKGLFSNLRLLCFAALRLVLVPVCILLPLRQLGLNPQLFGVCLIMLTTPVGSMTAMLAQEYDGDTELTTRGVALTSLLSVLTIPLVAALIL